MVKVSALLLPVSDCDTAAAAAAADEAAAAADADAAAKLSNSEGFLGFGANALNAVGVVRVLVGSRSCTSPPADKTENFPGCCQLQP